MKAGPLAIALLAAALTACAGTPPPTGTDDANADAPAAADPLQIYDPLEPLNRHMYRFNSLADRYFLLPAVRIYRTLLPAPARSGVANFFDNLNEITTFWNAALQAKPEVAAVTFSRFAINTTIGIGGLFDPATTLGLEQRREDLGQTLGVYGVGPGPYLVLPFFGPSTLRDGLGLGGDFALELAIDPARLDGQAGRRVGYWTLYVLDTRDRTRFRYYQTGSPFEYTLVRFVYENFRELEIQR